MKSLNLKFINILITLFIIAVFVLECFSKIFGALNFHVIKELFSILILSISWSILLLSYLWLYIQNKYILLKFIYAIVFLKIILFVAVKNVYSFQKEFLVIPLLVVIFLSKEGKTVICEYFIKYKKIILFIFLSTIIPFLHINNNNELYRYAGIWGFPHEIAYYCCAFMILFKMSNIFILLMLIIILIYTGAKSALISSAFIVIYILIKNKQYLKMFIMTFFSFILFLYYNLLNYLVNSFNSNFGMLLSKNISDDSYGAGRVLLNRILLNDIEKFNMFDWLLGKSASEMQSLYLKILGVTQWPHNDFVTGIYCHGVVLVMAYICYLFVIPVVRSKNKIEVSLISVSLLILAITNGFYTYNSFYMLLLLYMSNVVYEKEYLGV